MATPEMPRSGHTPISPDQAGEGADVTSVGPAGSPGGAVPPENRPGHHPEVEQDKPRRRPPSARGRAARGSRQSVGQSDGQRAEGRGAPSRPEEAGEDPTVTFDFAFEPRLRPLALLAGVRPGNARVEIGETDLRVRFGRWTLRTPIANVAGIQVTGPYTWWKVAGPAHLSFADGGITFATTTAGGVCVAFHEPVPGLVPGSAVRHPAATVTVSEPRAFVAAVEAAQLRLLAGASPT